MVENIQKIRTVPLAGIVAGQEEEDAVLDVIRSPWHVEGKYTELVEKELCKLYNVPYCIMTNSGSSANYLALVGLNLPKNSIVLSSACGFSMTLAPIIQQRYIPYLVDYDINTFNINLYDIERALKSTKIDAMLIAHNLGVSLDIDFLMALKKKYGFLLIEDACEGTGVTYNGQMIGTFGDIGTLSHYSSHITSACGGGGTILLKDEAIYNRLKSMKSWGKTNIRIGEYCTKFTTKIGDIPYDEGYNYATIGYNMRITDVQSAYLLQQLKRLPDFISKRQRNYKYLYEALKNLPIHRMRWHEKCEPVFFGFPIALYKDGIRDKLVEYLEENGIKTRLFLGGNLLRHDAYKGIAWLGNKNFEIADYLMKNAFFVGCWPGLTLDDMKYTADKIIEFFNTIEKGEE